MSLADGSFIARAKPTASQKIRVKPTTYASVGSFTSQTLIEYVPNGKGLGRSRQNGTTSTLKRGQLHKRFLSDLAFLTF